MGGTGRAWLVVLAAEGGQVVQRNHELREFSSSLESPFNACDSDGISASCMAPSLGWFVGLPHRTQFCFVLDRRSPGLDGNEKGSGERWERGGDSRGPRHRF